MRDADRHHRQSIRLRGYDYSQTGAYFITICTHDKECTFGEIVDDDVRLNELGRIAKEEWPKTAEIRDNVELDEFIIMPNHFHGIVFITPSPVGATSRSPTYRDTMRRPRSNECQHEMTGIGATGRSPLPRGPTQKSIGSIIAGFKSAVTKRINQMRGTPGAPIWQRNYYEGVVRNEKELNDIRQYIVGNPSKWAEDEENPNRVGDPLVAPTIMVISDTHAQSIDDIPKAILDKLAQIRATGESPLHIIHAGDFTDVAVLEGLRSLGEVHAVHGNMDSLALKQALPAKEVFVVNGKKIGLTHGAGGSQDIVPRIRKMFNDVDVIIFGHSHETYSKVIEGAFLFNPGSARYSFGLLTIEEEVKAEIIRV